MGQSMSKMQNVFNWSKPIPRTVENGVPADDWSRPPPSDREMGWNTPSQPFWERYWPKHGVRQYLVISAEYWYNQCVHLAKHLAKRRHKGLPPDPFSGADMSTKISEALKVPYTF